MHFFLDESGVFLPLEGAKERVSVVGGLVVPTHALADVFGEYWQIRDSLARRKGEIKGAAQPEERVAAVARLLAKHDALLEVTCADLGRHRSDEVKLFQDGQADIIEASAAEDLPDERRDHALGLAVQLRELPVQLFVQVLLYIDVIGRLLHHAPLYYVQREPRELGTFRWVVDRKGDHLTPFEDLWRQLIMPVLQTRSETDPMPFLEGADYSHFARFQTSRPEWTPIPDYATKDDRTVVDLHAVLSDELHFADSRDEVGLELADIAINGIARALNGSLQESGWRHLGKLILYREPQALRMVRLYGDPLNHGVVTERETDQGRVAQVIQSQAKSMLSDNSIFRLYADGSS